MRAAAAGTREKDAAGPLGVGIQSSCRTAAGVCLVRGEGVLISDSEGSESRVRDAPNGSEASGLSAAPAALLHCHTVVMVVVIEGIRLCRGSGGKGL